MRTQLLTPASYAERRGVSPVAVTRALKAGKTLIGVKSYEKTGRDWFLTVSSPLTKKNFGKIVVIQK